MQPHSGWSRPLVVVVVVAAVVVVVAAEVFAAAAERAGDGLSGPGGSTWTQMR